MADTPGEYYGQCTEFCGASHANMRFRVFVDTPSKRSMQWVAHQNRPPVKPTEGAGGRRSQDLGRRAVRNLPYDQRRFGLFEAIYLRVSAVPI